MNSAKLTCETCGEKFTEKRSKGHASFYGHYTFRTVSGELVNHSRYLVVKP